MIQHRTTPHSMNTCRVNFVGFASHGMLNIVSIYLSLIPDDIFSYFKVIWNNVVCIHNDICMYLMVLNTWNSSERFVYINLFQYFTCGDPVTRLQYIRNHLWSNGVCKYQQMWMYFPEREISTPDMLRSKVTGYRNHIRLIKDVHNFVVATLSTDGLAP